MSDINKKGKVGWGAIKNVGNGLKKGWFKDKKKKEKEVEEKDEGENELEEYEGHEENEDEQ
jgi:hypothetical protein